MTNAPRYAAVNGEVMLEKDACIPISDRGFQFGEGCFTTIRVSGGRPEWLEEHLARLERDSRELNIPKPRVSGELLDRVIEANGAGQGLWRCKAIATAGGNTVVTMAPYTMPRDPARVGILKNPPHSPYYRVKRLAYLDRFWIQRRAERDGLDDYVGIDGEGYLLEATFSNIVWFEGGVWRSPDYNKLPIMKGIALGKLLGEVQLGRYRPEEIGAEAKVYLCNALHHLRLVSHLLHREASAGQRLDDVGTVETAHRDGARSV